MGITSSALIFLSLGMAGYAVQNILSRAYFARQDGKTPLVAGGVSILVNIALCMVLTGPFQVAGLAFSSAVSSTVYALLLLLPMQRRGEGVLDRTMGLDLVKMLLAAAVTGLAAAGVLSLLTGVLPGGKIGELLSLGGCALVGLIVYFVLTLALAVPEAKLVVSLARGKHE